MDEEKVMELLSLYMEMTAKQEALIEDLTALVQAQGDHIRQLHITSSFFEDPEE